MSYYGAKGDFYGNRVGYYQGDPGIFAAMLPIAKAFIAKKVTKATGWAAKKIAGAAGQVGPMAAAAGRSVATVARRYPVTTGAIAGAAGGLSLGSMRPIPGMGGTDFGLEGGRKRRRMNVTNSKALRRAIRRARGFEKLARKVIGFASPRKPKGRTYFKARRKS